jgi:hypothetical protein
VIGRIVNEKFQLHHLESNQRPSEPKKRARVKKGKKQCMKDNGNQNAMKVVEEREGRICAVTMR